MAWTVEVVKVRTRGITYYINPLVVVGLLDINEMPQFKCSSSVILVI